MKTIHAINLLLAILVGFSSYSQHKDWSEELDANFLSGLLLDAINVERISDSTQLFFSEGPVSVERFKIKCEISVQVACSGVEGKFENAKANYIIEIAKDDSGRIGKKFFDSIYDFWTSKEEWYLRDYKYLPAPKHLFYRKGDYVLYSDPGSNNIGSFYLIYFDRRIIKVTFEGFDQGEGWGGLSAFLSEIVHFKFKNRRIKPDYKSAFDPRKFMELYQNDSFN